MTHRQELFIFSIGTIATLVSYFHNGINGNWVLFIFWGCVSVINAWGVHATLQSGTLQQHLEK